MKESNIASQAELLGHPTGLYTLFFAEMWERFSYYGMRALLLLYMLKAFMFSDKDANAVYGAYTALVYMTPFFGGMIADKLLGSRACVIIGGLLMAVGQALLTVKSEFMFYSGLGLLICGNGFFKPNISTIVGSLYPAGSVKRDGGFTIFYIGINLGAALAPLICAYIGETYGWNLGFGVASVGMLIGVAIFAAPTRLTQVLILLAAVASAGALVWFNSGDMIQQLSNYFVLLGLVVSAGLALMALNRGGLPSWAGVPPVPEKFWSHLTKVLLGTVIAIPVLVVLVSGFTVLPGVDSQYQLIGEETVRGMEESESPLIKGLAEFVKESSRPAGVFLIVAGLGACVYLFREMGRMNKIERERMYVVFILTFFMFVFWAFFEQSGSSVNNFTDRNIRRVSGATPLTAADVGKTVTLRLTVDDDDKGLDYLSQLYLGRTNGSEDFRTQLAKAVTAIENSKEEAKRLSAEAISQRAKVVSEHPTLTMTGMTYLREYAKMADTPATDKTITWTYTEENVGKIGTGGNEVPASIFQAINPVYIMIFGLVLTALWGYLGKKGLEPSTPLKFALGLLQLGLGFGCLWLGAQSSTHGLVASGWLLLMYLFLTTGELCSSPVGLSMVTKLTPVYLVNTIMGTWFLATSFSQFLAAIIAQFAAVKDAEVLPPPENTVNLYGDVFGMIAVGAMVFGVICLVLTPILKKWMHVGVDAKAS
jgi:proton-dependent oligopeptide transporter, POT family